MKLDVGPEVVGHLLPHGRPFRMVDRIVAFVHTPEPRIHARRMISQNEEVFSGHFPEWPLWPGALTIEALAQTTNLLLALDAMRQADPGSLEGLRALSRALRMEPVRDDEQPGAAMEALHATRALGVLSAVDVKLTRPVFAGSVLELHARTVGQFQDLTQVEVEAVVDKRLVAKGSLHVARRAPPDGLLQS